MLRALDRAAVPLAAVTLVKETGLAYNAVLQATARLAQAGLVTETPAGSSAVYALTPAHPFTAALRDLFSAERSRRRAIQDAVEDWASEQSDALRAVWLFGSVARRDDTFRSDMDLAVVASRRGEAQRYADLLRETLAPVAASHHLRPSVMSYDASELSMLPTEDPAMWASLMQDGVSLYGPGPNAILMHLAASPGQRARGARRARK